MEKVTITIEGTVDEVNNAVQKLSSRGLKEGAYSHWLPNEIEDFIEGLRPDAQRVIKEIAKSPGYDRDILIKKLGIESGRSLAGMLSSIGHNLKRDYPMKLTPLELDEDNKYEILPDFVDWIVSNAHE